MSNPPEDTEAYHLVPVDVEGQHRTRSPTAQMDASA